MCMKRLVTIFLIHEEGYSILKHLIQMELVLFNVHFVDNFDDVHFLGEMEISQCKCRIALNCHLVSFEAFITKLHV